METDKLKNNKIAIIGAGHMGNALAKGFLHCGLKKENLFLSNTSDDNKKVATKADWIIIAVKPINVQQVIGEIKDIIADKLLLSVAAGVTIEMLQQWTNNNGQKIIRLMPSLPITYNQGVIGFCANKNISDEEVKQTKNILSLLGTVIDCQNENDLDAITLIAGCGPALVCYFMEMLAQSGEEFGLTKEVSQQLALQTFIGTLTHLQKTKQSPIELQNSVATKGGVTETIIKSLDEKNLSGNFKESLETGCTKIANLKSSLYNEDK